jgi:hyperosmotically inducible periplasmic protein
MTNRNAYIAGAAALTLVTAIASAQTTAPDNSKANSDVMNSTSKTSTADAQKNDSTDIALTQQIRKSVMADKSLSTYAHNVKIVTVNGAVTLNGVVRDSREKDVVAMKAQAIAGKGNVTDDLTVAAPK